ncbi:4fe-4s ferredoxin, iron-sulfur binding protein [gamma proteobacterium HdN1]|nr:4fe-4s ferredoxin, iron-sulfur binding protein [gamma proteobacterium HdN1]
MSRSNSTPDARKIPLKDASPKGFSQTGQALYQKRDKVYARHITGIFQTLRWITVWATLGLYFILPWIQWSGRQAVLFDLPERKFYIFGLTFFPQDFLLLAGVLMISAFALFFFTVFAGRVWCGYACPQTVWTSAFMWVERIIEGDRNARIKLDKQPRNTAKTAKRSLKYTIWLLMSFITGFTFVGYFTPIRALGFDIAAFQLDVWGVFWLAFFTVMTFLNAGWLREQVCIYMCPYARFQSVMFDRDTLIVTYDAARGEARGKRKKAADPKALDLGDCVDCQLCVQVCPTGIDIRNGLQYECIGCAACIDACDSIMDQMNYPRGLIRYSTENRVEKQPAKILRPRLIGYGLVTLVLLAGFGWRLISRVPVELDVSRDRTALYRENFDGQIENVYTLHIQNKTQETHSYTLSFGGLNGATLDAPKNIRARAGEQVTITATVSATPESIPSPNIRVQLTLQALDDPAISVTQESRFLSPRR